jgi:hypothetical protein
MRPLSYEVKSRLVGGVMKPHAVTVCVRCKAEGSLAMPRDGHNPEQVQQKFQREGWRFDAWSRGFNVCRSCVEKAAHKHSQGGVVVPMKSATAPAVAPAAIAAKIEQTSPALRKRVRDLLAGVFDEDKGFYLDGYSDPRVAAECEVAEVVVREIREKAFGPLKSSPELDALGADLAALHKLQAEALQLLTRLSADMADVQRRLDETRARLGIKAAA